jgi:hypothetical protein
MDEQPVQLLGEKREPIPMNEHHEKWEDNEYVRKGICSVFMFVEPHVKETDKTAGDKL